MTRNRATAVCAASVLAVGLGTILHEGAHVLTGFAVGGTPTLWTATEVRGDFDMLSPAGFVAFGASGSVVNVVLCLLGWWLLRRARGATSRLSAWFLFAVNGMLASTKVLMEPLSGFGDWMTILGHLPATGTLRIVASLVGAVATVAMVKLSAAGLSTLIAPGERAERRAEAFRVVLLGAAAGTLLMALGGVVNPVGPTRAMLLAAGAGFGPFVPLLFAVRRVPSTAPENASPGASANVPLIAVAAVIAAVVWFVIGPGITLSKPM